MLRSNPKKVSKKQRKIWKIQQSAITLCHKSMDSQNLTQTNMHKLFIFLVALLTTYSLVASSPCEELKARFSYKTSGLTVSFIDNSLGNYDKILWTFSDGTSSQEKNPSHTFSKPGEQKFSLTITNEEGCSQSFQGKVYLFP